MTTDPSNTPLTNLQGNVFYFKAEISGQVFRDGNFDARLNPGEQGLAGIRVQLLIAKTREIVATTETDARGEYRFDVSSGVRTGDYFVQEVLPTGATRTTPAVPVISITRGDIRASNVNIGLLTTATALVSPPKQNDPPGSRKPASSATGPAAFTPLVMEGVAPISSMEASRSKNRR